ncbi:retrovirus-related pol polyprotein from transposon TNT 1-94 [Tanacetum coccineum]|uniref:Retrovirus-related pol polyprotein from transposon TNT 1-94 n=1 Tax=Tanacetum coccineum TaxID=301880 RepID=A0ABQ5GX05_9ASTR
MSKGLESRQKPSNPSKNKFKGRVKGLKVFVGNFTYKCNFMILEDTTSIIDHHIGEVVFGKPFVRETGLVYDQEEGTVVFEKDNEKITFKMPHKMETFNHIKFKDVDTNSIPPFVLENNDNHGKPYYSYSLILGLEYREYKSISKEIQHVMKLEKEAWESVRPSKKRFKLLSLDESRSPDFDLFLINKILGGRSYGNNGGIMEQYIKKTRAAYGSGVARPKIEDKDNFELTCQFLKELRSNTFSGSDHEDANKHIEKVLEIVNLFHIPNITIDQAMLRAFPMSLTRAASRWLRNKSSGSITTWEDLKTKFLSKYYPPARTAKKMEEINNFQQESDETLYQAWERFKELLMKCPQHYLTEMQEVMLFYNGLEVSTRQILDSRGAIPSKTDADAKVAIQVMAEYSQKWYNRTLRIRSTETSEGLAAIQAQLNKIGRENQESGMRRFMLLKQDVNNVKGPTTPKISHLKKKVKPSKKLTTLNLVDLSKEGDIE